MSESIAGVDKMAERFARDTADHTMAVLHDDGLYRHLRFTQPRNEIGWFDLITVPGALIFQGDGDSFVFRRISDMFAFFRDSAWAGRPNIGHWEEKMTDDPKRAYAYSEDRFREYVQESVDSCPELIGLADAVRERVLEHEWGIDHEAGARQALSDFSFYANPDDRYSGKTPDFLFEDAAEADFQDYYWWFLWACHAIVWGIAQYDAAKLTAVAS